MYPILLSVEYSFYLSYSSLYNSFALFSAEFIVGLFFMLFVCYICTDSYQLHQDFPSRSRVTCLEPKPKLLDIWCMARIWVAILCMGIL